MIRQLGKYLVWLERHYVLVYNIKARGLPITLHVYYILRGLAFALTARLLKQGVVRCTPNLACMAG